MFAQKDEKEFWLDWLQKYKEFKCLWDYESKRNSSRSDRQEAYQKLANLAKTINPDADVNYVRSRINGFRTCYRREFKKMEAAKQNGIEYTPQLFYFEALKFVNIEEYAFDNTFESDGHLKPEIFSSEYGEVPIPSARRQASNQETAKLSFKKDVIRRTIADRGINDEEKRKTPKIDHNSEFHVDLEQFDGYSEIGSDEMTNEKRVPRQKTEDEYALFGKRIAAHFRNMEPKQRLFAEKIISDVCIYARMERLTLQSSVMVNLTPTENSLQQTDENVDYDDPDTYIYT